MLIECEIKTCQTVESIENTRREGGQSVVAERMKGNEKKKKKTREERYLILVPLLKTSAGRDVS